MEPKYKTIIDHYENCLKLHGDNHLGVDWPNASDAEKRYVVMLNVIKDKQSPVTLLDFGCGTASLYQHILSHKIANVTYSGLDASKAFYEVSKTKFPELEFLFLDVLNEPHKLREYDYIVMNGVFTEKNTMSFNEMFEYFTQLISVVFSKAKKGIAFNVMSTAVDWERDDLFHLPTDKLIHFLTKNLSRHFVIRNDYGLYEYTVYLYKEPQEH